MGHEPHRLREAKAIACVDLHGSLDDLRWHLKALDDRNGLETLGALPATLTSWSCCTNAS